MKLYFLIPTMILSSALLIGCSDSNNKVTEQESDLEKSTSISQNNPNETMTDSKPIWTGEYEGIFPCANCEGIKVKLQLNANMTYELNEEYLGVNPKTETETKGSFSFDTKDASLITLDEKAEQRKFLISDGYIEAREIETGNKIESNLNYKLIKQNDE